MNSLVAHDVPEDDWIEHEIDGDKCICGPDVIYELTSNVITVKHHALDGREEDNEI